MIPDPNQIRAAAGLLDIKSTLQFFALAFLSVMGSICFLMRGSLAEKIGPGRWLAVMITLLLLAFTIFIGFMLITLRDARATTVTRGRRTSRGTGRAPELQPAESRAA